jgi:hypothetical protein
MGAGVRELAGIVSLGVRVRDLCGAASERGVGVRDLCGSTSQRGVGVRDLSGAMRGAGRQRELVGIARVDSDVVGADEFVGDTRMGVGAGEFVGDAHAGAGPGGFAGIGCGIVWPIGGDTVRASDRDVLRVAVTHLDNCWIELDQVAKRSPRWGIEPDSGSAPDDQASCRTSARCNLLSTTARTRAHRARAGSAADEARFALTIRRRSRNCWWATRAALTVDSAASARCCFLRPVADQDPWPRP